jgi:hypothetical protein
VASFPLNCVSNSWELGKGGGEAGEHCLGPEFRKGARGSTMWSPSR